MPSPEGEGRDLRSGSLLQRETRGGHVGPLEVVRVVLLGGFCVWVGPQVIEKDEWRLYKATVLVKLLALAPHHSLHREQVMETLWPELEPKAAANNLYRTLHAARRVLEPGSGGGRSQAEAKDRSVGADVCSLVYRSNAALPPRATPSSRRARRGSGTPSFCAPSDRTRSPA
jgi:hypothetical protein